MKQTYIKPATNATTIVNTTLMAGSGGGPTGGAQGNPGFYSSRSFRPSRQLKNTEWTIDSDESIWDEENE